MYFIINLKEFPINNYYNYKIIRLQIRKSRLLLVSNVYVMLVIASDAFSVYFWGLNNEIILIIYGFLTVNEKIKYLGKYV